MIFLINIILTFLEESVVPQIYVSPLESGGVLQRKTNHFNLFVNHKSSIYKLYIVNLSIYLAIIIYLIIYLSILGKMFV